LFQIRTIPARDEAADIDSGGSHNVQQLKVAFLLPEHFLILSNTSKSIHIEKFSFAGWSSFRTRGA
jgi:hypothetical protein